jgi:hypothetical protein
VRQQGGLARDRAQQQVFHLGRHDGVEHGWAAMGHRIDGDDLAFLAGAVVLRELAERPLRFAHAGQQATFDDDLGLGRHAHLVGQALDHRQRLAMESARNFQFVAVDRGDGLRGERRQRVHADHDRHFKRFPIRLCSGKEGMQVAWQDQDAEPVRAVDLDSIDRDVLHAGLRISSDHQARGDVGTMVVFAVRRDRQKRTDVAIAVFEAVHDLLDRRHGFVDLAPGQRLLGRSSELLQQASLRHPHRFGNPGALGHETGDHDQAAPLRKQRRHRPSRRWRAASSCSSATRAGWRRRRLLAARWRSQPRRLVWAAVMTAGALQAVEWRAAWSSGSYSPDCNLRRSTLPTGLLGISRTKT